MGQKQSKNEFQETTITTRVLGGDTFTCTSFMRTRIRETQDTLERGKNYGTVFVSQSRVNASMRTKNEENFVFPVDSQDESLWLLGPSELQLDSNGNPQGWNVGLINQVYDQSYNINDSVIGPSTSTAYSSSISFRSSNVLSGFIVIIRISSCAWNSSMLLKKKYS